MEGGGFFYSSSRDSSLPLWDDRMLSLLSAERGNQKASQVTVLLLCQFHCVYSH